MLYSVFRILPASDSWAWIRRQFFENAHYSALHAQRRTDCLAHTTYHPRFFWENVNDIVSGSAGQYFAHTVVREILGKFCFMC